MKIVIEIRLPVLNLHPFGLMGPYFQNSLNNQEKAVLAEPIVVSRFWGTGSELRGPGVN